MIKIKIYSTAILSTEYTTFILIPNPNQKIIIYLRSTKLNSIQKARNQKAVFNLKHA